MNQEKQQKIEEYLADEDKLFGDWYHSLGDPDFDPDIQPVGIIKPEEIKKRFEDWFQGNKKTLKNGICNDWHRLLKDDVVLHSMIALLAQTIETLHFQIPVHCVAVAAILLTKGYMERLCSDEQGK
jgi:hypothetical protein